MPENTPKQIPAQNNQNLRRPPTAGGPRRLQPREEVITRPHPRKKSFIKRALPFLLPGMTTGAGLAFGLTDFFGS